ncbi:MULTISPECIES: hypothetical protein [unclassified Rhodococcus (in: high G+C Gram-positive bacteria)]|uniref:hypothetical protein n=1 Tax=unclassified Rhodococcus (in: high G+C Gram-positive bacteria) TaxID=192944 RepID=UPI000A449E71|nr:MULTISPECIES: hypothetical protein [unclassified Rhodococcus (in: high G+C Gram-positive bacteria)]
MRRTRKALAGWVDSLQGRSENPPLQPWRPWGDPRTVSITPAGMVLGNDGGWFQPNPDGGIGYEHMPLTPNWEFEFTRALASYTQDGRFVVYIDRNWTAGGSAAATRYQTYLELERDTDEKENDDGTTTRTVRRRVQLFLREKGAWFIAGSFGATLDNGQWSKPIAVRVRVYRDRVVIVWIDGTRYLFGDITDARYNFTGGQRSANFTQQSGPVVTLTNFATRDVAGLRSNWISHFYDDFNRPDTTTVGNGWQNAGGEYGIYSGALSMQSPFLPPGDGFRRAWRGPAPSENIRVEVTFGGGTSKPEDLASAFVVVRANSAMSSGLAFRIQKQQITLMRITGVPTSSGALLELIGQRIPYILDNPMKLAFHVDGDLAWVDRIDGGRNECLFWCDGVAGQVLADQRYYGAIHQRFAFTNPAPFNDFRVLNAA